MSWGDVDRWATLGFTEEAVGGTVMGSGGEPLASNERLSGLR